MSVEQLTLDTTSNAVFSPDRAYRYALHRVWEQDAPRCLFIGLNPSTADERKDDPTIRRCIRFARDWGYGGLTMANLYAFRATKPRDLHSADDPVGVDNDEALGFMAKYASLTVAAWGADPGPDPDRPELVIELLRDLHVLGLTKHGSPRHPLYMRADSKPQLWRRVR